MIFARIWKNSYYDSVSLMLLEQKAQSISGVNQAAIVMGTDLNREILKNSGLFTPEMEDTGANDLIMALNLTDPKIEDEVIKQIETWLTTTEDSSDDSFSYSPKSLHYTLNHHQDANLVLISVPGRFAAREAMFALKKNRHVMLFSDNVTIEEEKELKEFASEKGLLVMGPDCGTAIINQVPLAFANQVKKGSIGIVGASGTGIQEVTCCIDRFGGGITQAIGTGGRDLKEEIGGLMMLSGIQALNRDPETKIIVLVSKPPAPSVEDKILSEVSKLSKPVIIHFIGGSSDKVTKSGAIWGDNLADAAHKAVCLEKNRDISSYCPEKPEWNKEIQKITGKFQSRQKYIRGLFTGGTLCDEAMLLFKAENKTVYSNTPLKGMPSLQNSQTSEKNTIIDLGDDEFTVGRAHPMIDPTLRIQRIEKEGNDPETAIILLDVVLGYGSHESPGTVLIPAIKKVMEKSPSICFIASITGTQSDFQDYTLQTRELLECGVQLFDSNAAACNFALKLINKMEELV